MAKTPRLGRRERIARRLEKARRKANAQARPETEANSKGDVLAGTPYRKWLVNADARLAADRLKAGTHHTTCFRAGVSNLRDGKNVTYGKAKIVIHVPGTVVSTKAKAAVKRNMARTLGIKQRFAKQIAGSVDKRSPSKLNNNFEVVKGPWSEKKVLYDWLNPETGQKERKCTVILVPAEKITSGRVKV